MSPQKQSRRDLIGSLWAVLLCGVAVRPARAAQTIPASAIAEMERPRSVNISTFVYDAKGECYRVEQSTPDSRHQVDFAPARIHVTLYRD